MKIKERSGTHGLLRRTDARRHLPYMASAVDDSTVNIVVVIIIIIIII